MTALSNDPKSMCCIAPLKAIRDYEGTSYYICTYCREPADVLVNITTSEPVSPNPSPSKGLRKAVDNEPQKVAEWLTGFGFKRHKHPSGRIEYVLPADLGILTINQDQATFFYRAAHPEQGTNFKLTPVDNSTLSNSTPLAGDEREALIEKIGSLTVGEEPHEIRNFLGFAATGVVADFILADRQRILDRVEEDARSLFINFDESEIKKILARIRKEEL